jgi:phytanoyl-CoA hydroxylase
MQSPPEPFVDVVASEDAVRVASELPLGTRFRLGTEITPVQDAFLDLHGFLVFDRVASTAEVDEILAEADGIQQRIFEEGRTRINGVPIWTGLGADGEPMIQRLAFTSLFSDTIHSFVRDPRFEPVRRLIGENTRVGDREKDGVVLNRYVRAPGSLRPQLGWHTDGLRDLFYGRMPQRMLNVGLHFDRIRPEDGGLRLIPGTHEQGLLSTIFRKPYFIWHRPDPAEVAVETWPGDLTVHDGRLWHRVAGSPHTGAQSLRRSMYVPYLTHAYDPKTEASKTPIYQVVFDWAMRAKQRMGPRPAR